MIQSCLLYFYVNIKVEDRKLSFSQSNFLLTINVANGKIYVAIL